MSSAKVKVLLRIAYGYPEKQKIAYFITAPESF